MGSERGVGRRVLVIVLSIAVGLGVVLVVGVLVSAVVGERGAVAHNQLGVVTSNGTVSVVTCRSQGIGLVELQAGANEGPLVWSAQLRSGTARQSVEISAQAPSGYRVTARGLPLEPGRNYAIRQADDGEQRLLADSYLVFKPRQLTPGRAYLGDGKSVLTHQWMSAPARCGR